MTHRRCLRADEGVPQYAGKVGQFGTNIPTAEAVFGVGVVAIKKISAG